MKLFYFYDLPVYRLPRDIYYREQDEYVKKATNHKFYLENEKDKIKAELIYSDIFGGMWEYNEIIGYIRLHLLCNQIRGEYYANKCKRHVKTRKKKFVLETPKIVTEKELPFSNNNEEIYNAIWNYVITCKSERIFRKRYIDTDLFEQLGPHINWCALLNLNEKYSSESQ